MYIYIYIYIHMYIYRCYIYIYRCYYMYLSSGLGCDLAIWREGIPGVHFIESRLTFIPMPMPKTVCRTCL